MASVQRTRPGERRPIAGDLAALASESGFTGIPGGLREDGVATEGTSAIDRVSSRTDALTIADASLTAALVGPRADAAVATEGASRIDLAGLADAATATDARALTAAFARADSAALTDSAIGGTSTPPANILRTVSHATALNPYPGWDAVFNSGTGLSTRVSATAEGFPVPGAVGGDGWLAKAQVDTTDTSTSDGTRLTWVTPGSTGLATSGGVLGDFYYSTWILFPTLVTIPQGGAAFWNIQQFKRYLTSTGDHQPMWSVNCARRNGTTGNMRFELYRYIGTNFVKDGPGTGIQATAAIDIPVGQWIHLETHYVVRTDNTGRVRSWQTNTAGGTPTLLWDFQNVPTEYTDSPAPNGNSRHFTFNNYCRQSTPAVHSLYYYRSRIADGQVGAV